MSPLLGKVVKKVFESALKLLKYLSLNGTHYITNTIFNEDVQIFFLPPRRD
jgi:hypothetical protein